MAQTVWKAVKALPRTSRNKPGARRGEAGFTVLEAALALAVTLGVALAAAELLRVSGSANGAARDQAEALAAAEAALARIGADLPAEPGRWLSDVGPVQVEISLTPFVAQAEAAGAAAGFRLPPEDQDEENRRKLRGRALLAVATARFAARAGRSPRQARLSRIVIGPPQDDKR